MAKEYQATEKARRAQKHNESLSRAERATVPESTRTADPVATDEPGEPDDTNESSPDENTQSLFRPGDRAWLFYPVVHVSRLKAVNEFGERPRTRLAPDVTEETILDFDEELLPEDSWEPDRLAGEYEVEAILDDRVPLLNSTERAVREFLVKWVGYEDPTWEPAANLSCGGLLYDYLREKRSAQRLQMAQVADED
ncbi:hypothetical protein PR002_g19977 [Phytophthora rubi]|uniref:Chromo domain-containing protein n=1 Tax=Phytophthora rubi TaxID=129364 RepID=A0A6A3JJK8_9STRA|nr:hypothetical protein PR002_g19977 [Phytophthora rubi]